MEGAAYAGAPGANGVEGGAGSGAVTSQDAHGYSRDGYDTFAAAQAAEAAGTSAVGGHARTGPSPGYDDGSGMFMSAKDEPAADDVKPADVEHGAPCNTAGAGPGGGAAVVQATSLPGALPGAAE